MLTAQLLLVVILVIAVATGCFFIGRHLRGGLVSDHLAGIGRIREIGEYVALRTECRDIGRVTDRSHWFGRGRLLLATCEMIIEHRFDLRAMQINQYSGGVELVLPPAKIVVSHGDVRIEHMQAGTILGIPVRRVRERHINRLLGKARDNMTANQERPNDYLTTRARESVRSFLLSVSTQLDPTLCVRIVFDDEAGSAEIHSRDLRTIPPAPDSVAGTYVALTSLPPARIAAPAGIHRGQPAASV